MKVSGLLPVGSVVSLKNVDNLKVIVCGYCARKAGENGHLYDYTGCIYPVGVIQSDQMLMFNQPQITTIHHIGFLDEAGIKLMAQMEQALAALRNKEAEENAAKKEDTPVPEA